MKDEDLIDAINSKITKISESNSLQLLSSLKPNGTNVDDRYHEVTRHCSCILNGKFSYQKNIEELLLISDEIVYFTANLFFYRPYINTPLKNAYQLDSSTTVYPVYINLAGKRYNMYLNVCFEKVYNYWSRIGDLIASYFPDQYNKKNVYFIKVVNDLKDYAENPDYDWLKDFVENEFKSFNDTRREIVHKHSTSTTQKWNQLEHVTDYKKAKDNTEEILSYPEYFKKMNELCIIGFEKTLNLLEAINVRENYNCEDLE